MALGIGLVTPPGPDGRPMMLFLLDVRLACSGCGHSQQVRYFRETPFHSLTLRRLELILQRAGEHIDEICDQCDAAMAADEEEAVCLSVGFADGQGVIQGFRDTERLVWSLRPHDVFDVQMIARYEPVEDIACRNVSALSEDACRDVFGRAFNPKAALRQAIVAWGGCDVAELELAEGLRVRLLPAGVRAIEEGDAARSVVLVEGGAPASGWPAAPAEWLLDLDHALRDARVVAQAEVAPIRASLERHLATFPIDTRLVEAAPGQLEAIAGDGSEYGSRILFDLDEIAREAARTCCAPGDIARVELDRALTLIQLSDDDGVT